MWMVAANFRRTQPKSVGLRVAFTRCSLLLLLELCTIGYTTREAAWSVDWGGPKEQCIGWGPDFSRERAISEVCGH